MTDAPMDPATPPPGASAVNVADLMDSYDRELAQANRRALIAESSVRVLQSEVARLRALVPSEEPPG